MGEALSRLEQGLSAAETAWLFLRERWTAGEALDERAGLIAFLAVAGLCFVPQLWRVVRQAATIVHEMGHVIAAWATGRHVTGIKLHTDTSGVTVSWGKTRGLGMVVTSFFGYPAPGLLAASMAWLASLGQAGAALTLYQLLLAFSVLLSRNVVGVASCLLALVSTGLIWWHNDDALVTGTVVVLCAFYAVAGLRCTWDVTRVHLRPVLAGRTDPEETARLSEAASTTDASQAARSSGLLPLPAGFWLMGFWAAAAVSLWLTVRLLGLV